MHDLILHLNVFAQRILIALLLLVHSPCSVKQLSPGVHVVSNGSLHQPVRWFKALHGEVIFKNVLSEHAHIQSEHLDCKAPTGGGGGGGGGTATGESQGNQNGHEMETAIFRQRCRLHRYVRNKW